MTFSEEFKNELAKPGTRMVTFDMTPERVAKYERLSSQIIDLLQKEFQSPTEAFCFLNFIVQGLQETYDMAEQALNALRQWEANTGGEASATEGNAFIDGFRAGAALAAEERKELEQRIKELEDKLRNLTPGPPGYIDPSWTQPF